MSAGRIKPHRKIQRRGNRLIATHGNERIVFQAIPGTRRRRVIEVTRPNEHYTVTHSPDGSFAIATGEYHGKSVQIVSEADYFGKLLALRVNDEPWVFIGDADELLVSIDDCGIANVALAASIVVAELDTGLANLLGVHPALCRINNVDEIHNNPRWKALREFKFELMQPTEPVGTGRRAANAIRHRHSNYDAMLRECGVGGLLYPQQYEAVRKGVDRLVAQAGRQTAPV
jgi:hypothetical protein